MEGPDRVPRFARHFVLVVIVAMCASAVFVLEPWPLTSFRLFSHLRTDEQTSWHATTLERDGTEASFSFEPLGHGFRNFGFRMAEFAVADEPRQDELCRTWVEAAREIAGRETIEVRLYQREWLLSERAGDRARPGISELKFRCSDEGVRVVG